MIDRETEYSEIALAEDEFEDLEGEAFEGEEGYLEEPEATFEEDVGGEEAFEGETESEGYGFESEFGDFEGDDVGLVTPDTFETAEDAEFLGKLFRKVGRWVKKGVRWIGKRLGPLFKKLAPIAAKIVGGAIGGPAGAMVGGALANAILREAESESAEAAEEAVLSGEIEFESVGGDSGEYAAMEEYAEAYASAESSAVAEASLAGLIRGAARMFARNRRLRPIIPRVARAAFALARTFRANPRTRFAIRLIPQIVARTLGTLARMRRITPRAVVQVMAKQTARVLASRQRAAAALRHRRRRVHQLRRRHPARCVCR